MKRSTRIVITKTMTMMTTFASMLMLAPDAHAGGGDDVLWDNGVWDGMSNLSSVRNPQLDAWVVDDVIFMDTVRIHTFSWWSIMPQGVEPTGADFIILSESFDPVIELDHLPTTRDFEQDFGQSETHAVYEATIDQLDIVLPPGRYFIGGRPVYDDPISCFATLKAEVLGKSQAYFRAALFGFPDWTLVEGTGRPASDASFTVFGEVVHQVLSPDSFNVIFGQTVEGGVDSLHESDDEYLRILNWPALSLTLPVIRMITETHTQIDDPSSIVITVETAANSQPNQPLQRVQAFDFDAQQWITIDERFATQNDSSIQITLDQDDEPTRFIEPDTGRLRLRLDWFDPGPVVNVGWGVRFDQVRWEAMN